jgi:hypothetical protein
MRYRYHRQIGTDGAAGAVVSIVTSSGEEFELVFAILVLKCWVPPASTLVVML